MVNTTTTENPLNGPDKLPFWSHVLALILYILLFLLALLGNTVALWILRKNHELRVHTLAHAFLTNLVVADLLLSLLTPFEALSIFLRSYFMGNAGCKLQRTFLYFFYAASILTLAAISLERFVAICHPMSYDSFKKRKTKIIAGIWLTSVIIVVPHVYLSEQRTLYGDTVCFQFYMTENSRIGFFWGYIVPCFLLLYLAPLTMMSITYWRAAQKLAELEKRLQVNSQCDLSVAVHMRQEFLKMLFVVVVLFIVQWTPFEIVEILATAPGSMIVQPISSLRVAVNMLAFSNAVFNPVVFGFMSKPFSEGFKEAWLYLFHFRCCLNGQGQCRLCFCWPKKLSFPMMKNPLPFKFKRGQCAGSSSDVSGLSQATVSRSEIDWDSSFGRLDNPVSIVERVLPNSSDRNAPDGCPVDHAL